MIIGRRRRAGESRAEGGGALSVDGGDRTRSRTDPSAVPFAFSVAATDSIRRGPRRRIGHRDSAGFAACARSAAARQIPFLESHDAGRRCDGGTIASSSFLRVVTRRR